MNEGLCEAQIELVIDAAAVAAGCTRTTLPLAVTECSRQSRTAKRTAEVIRLCTPLIAKVSDCNDAPLL